MFEDLGNGVVLFKQSVNVPEGIIEELDSAAVRTFEDHYKFVYDDNGDLLYSVNPSGHKWRAAVPPARVMSDLDPDFFGYCDSALYQNLIEYISLYPYVLPSLWWEVGGHVVVYRESASLGYHSDNDINYFPGETPPDQSALQFALSGVVALNDDYVGGKFRFHYLDLTVELERGDVLLYPSNFIATHSVGHVESGTRYSYVTWFGQGSEASDRNIEIHDYREPGIAGKTWLSNIRQDFHNYIIKNNLEIPAVLKRLPDHEATMR